MLSITRILLLAVLVSTALFILALTVRDDLHILARSAMLAQQRDYFPVYPVALTLIGTVLPVLIVFPLNRIRTSVHGGWQVRVFGSLIILYPISVPVFLGFAIELVFFPFSLLPLVTIYCGIIWIVLGTLITKGLPRTKRIVVVSLVFVLIVSIRFVGWPPRRSFVMDLLKIPASATVREVESIMGGYIKSTERSTTPYNPNQDSEAPHRVFYRHSDRDHDTHWGVVVIRDGKVETVKFSPR